MTTPNHATEDSTVSSSLQPNTAVATSFQDTSEDCAICLEPLYSHDSSNTTSDVLTLTCGHRWHYACLAQQLQTAQPVASQRLLFSGCQCAKCGQICEHERLQHLTRTTDALRAAVDALLQPQLAVDEPALFRQAQEASATDPTIWTKVLQDARRKYAFYLCAHCRQPFFGGTVACADQQNDDQNNNQPRLCNSCTPETQTICRDPAAHGGHLIWKCHYCCRPASHICYGRVHFCSACHARHSQQVQQQQQQQQSQSQQSATSSSPSSSNTPPPLGPIPCPGTTCPYPKPDGVTHHTHGVEHVYTCAWCQSVTQVHELQAPGSSNLLRNPSGAEGLRHWQQLNPHMAWAVEESEVPVNSTTTTNFVSSFLPCVMQQTVDLRQHVRVQNDDDLPPLDIEIAARFRARTDCPSQFALQGLLSRDAQNNHAPVRQVSTQTLPAPPDYWERARLVLEQVRISQTPYVSVIVMGKDTRFWQGRYGAKVADVSVRSLGTPERLEPWLVRTHDEAVGEEQANEQEAHGPPPAMVQEEAGPHHPAPQRPMPPNGINKLLCEGLLPIIVFVLLWWLLPP